MRTKDRMRHLAVSILRMSDTYAFRGHAHDGCQEPVTVSFGSNALVHTEPPIGPAAG